MTRTTRFWLMIETKMNRPRFIFHSIKMIWHTLWFANCKSMIITGRNRKSTIALSSDLLNWLNTRKKHMHTHTYHRSRHQGYEQATTTKNEMLMYKINLILALYDSIRLECVPLISRCRHVKYCRGQYAIVNELRPAKKPHASHVALLVFGSYSSTDTSTFPFVFFGVMCLSDAESVTAAATQHQNTLKREKKVNVRIVNPQSACIFPYHFY